MGMNDIKISLNMKKGCLSTEENMKQKKDCLIFWLALFRLAVVVDFFLSIQKHIKKFCASGKYFFIFYIFRMSIEKSEKYYVMLKSYALVKIQQCFLEKNPIKCSSFCGYYRDCFVG